VVQIRRTARWLVLGVAAAMLSGSMTPAHALYRPFAGGSYWNRPLPKDAPRHRDSAAIMRFLRADNDTNYIRLAGATETGEWGMPIYWPGKSAPIYDVGRNCSVDQPREFNRVRIPRGARPDHTADAAMTVVDRNRGITYGFHHARYDREHDRWTTCGGTVYYLDSNGLHGDLRASDDERNRGHRGIPPTVMAVRYDEVRAGRIDHILKIAVHTTACRHVFPMIDDECGTWHEDAPPEGTRIRIRPGVNLERLHLSPSAMVIAKALKRYGAIIGDQSGGPIVLKLENTVAERRGFLWEGRLTPTSLEHIPLSAFEVIAPGYRP
jgi:hypothetical protein